MFYATDHSKVTPICIFTARTEPPFIRKGMTMIKTVTDHLRLAEETKKLAEACAKAKGISRSAFYRLAVEEAVNKYRPIHRIAEPEIVE